MARARAVALGLCAMARCTVVDSDDAHLLSEREGRLSSGVDRAEAVGVGQLIRRRFLYVIDDENIDSRLRRLQLQPELLLKRCKERRTGVRLIRRPCQVDVVEAPQLCVINNDLLYRRSEYVGQLRHEVARSDEPSGRPLHAA